MLQALKCVKAQMKRYMEQIVEGNWNTGLKDKGDTNIALRYWENNKLKYPALYNLAMKVLTVPAKSAPVERVFSRGGIILRPHRARLSAKLFEMLMFLKCNEKVSFLK